MYENPSTGERTKIGTAHVHGAEFTATLDPEYTYFFSPASLHHDFSFVAEIKEVKCGPVPYRPKEW